MKILVVFPIIRTSVRHGTAFEIAGNGIARGENLIEAKIASELAVLKNIKRKYK